MPLERAHEQTGAEPAAALALQRTGPNRALRPPAADAMPRARLQRYPPQKPEARRSAAERERFDHRRVRATGLLYANIPGPGAAIRAPCLGDISTIEPAPD